MMIRKVMRTHNSVTNSAVSSQLSAVRIHPVRDSSLNGAHPFTHLSAAAEPAKAEDKGFTVIETVIVIVIVAILAAVAILRNPFDNIKLNSVTRKVAADIRYVQKLSVSNQTRAGMTFDNVNDGYTVWNFAWSTIARSPGDPCSTDAANNFVVDFTAPRCSNYANVQITVPTPNPVAFNSLGTPVNQWGTIIVGSNPTITLSLTGVPPQQITIQEATGMVSY